MSKLTIKYVFFDLDGTLVDTEKYYRKCWPIVFSKFGYTVDDDFVLSLRSMGHPQIDNFIKTKLGYNYDYENIAKELRILVGEKIKSEGLELKQGALESLKFLKNKNIPVAIVTTSSEERTNNYIRQLHIDNYIKEIISGNVVKNGKPEPDIYLYACERVNISPNESLVIEDSPNGILSANKAGCNVIMVPDQSEANELTISKVLTTLDSLNDLGKYIESGIFDFKQVEQ